MISFVLPVYNEADKLERNFKRLRNFLTSFGVDYEIIIAEDGSTDGSDKIARKLAKLKNVTHVHSDRRLGKGGAIKNVSSLVKGEFVILMDVDLAVNLGYIKKLIMNLKDYDIVIGSRYVKGSKSFRRFHRLSISKIYNFLIRLFFPNLKIKDTKCGFKGFKKEVFVSLNREVWSSDWSWDLEFLVRARRNGFSILEMPVEWHEGKKTKMNLLIDGSLQLLEVMIIRLLTLGKGYKG